MEAISWMYAEGGIRCVEALRKMLSTINLSREITELGFILDQGSGTFSIKGPKSEYSGLQVTVCFN